MFRRVLVVTSVLALPGCNNKKDLKPKEVAPVVNAAPSGPQPSPPETLMVLRTDAAANPSGSEAPSVDDAGVDAQPYVPSKPAGKVEKQLRLLIADLPIGMKTDACDELCMIEAVCSEKVSGEDYRGGSRCMDSCESWGDGGVRIAEECVRVALTCASALQCFD